MIFGVQALERQWSFYGGSRACPEPEKDSGLMYTVGLCVVGVTTVQVLPQCGNFSTKAQ